MGGVRRTENDCEGVSVLNPATEWLLYPRTKVATHPNATLRPRTAVKKWGGHIGTQCCYRLNNLPALHSMAPGVWLACLECQGWWLSRSWPQPERTTQNDSFSLNGSCFLFFSFSKPKQNKRVFLQISPLSLHLNWPTFFCFLFFVFGREADGRGGSNRCCVPRWIWGCGGELKIMGKSNSKLKPEVVEELTRKTYCECL